jgi:hypothetical protein
MKSLFEDYTLQELLDEVDAIEAFEYPNRKMQIGEITNKQMLLI